MNIFLPCWVATCSIFRRTNWLLYIEKCLGQLFLMLLYRKSGDDFSTSLKKKLIRWFKLFKIFIFIFIFVHEFVGMRGFLGQQKIVGGVEVSTQLFVCFKTQFIYFFHKWQVIPHIILLQSGLDTKKMQLIDKIAR